MSNTRPTKVRRGQLAVPVWVTVAPPDALHALAARFLREYAAGDLSTAQEWLWDRVRRELEFRFETTENVLERCWCDVCRSPFFYEQGFS